MRRIAFFVSFVLAISFARVQAEINPGVDFSVSCYERGTQVIITTSVAEITCLSVTWPGCPAGFESFVPTRLGTFSLDQSPGWAAIRIEISDTVCRGGGFGILKVRTTDLVQLYPVEWEGPVPTSAISDCTDQWHYLSSILFARTGECATSGISVDVDTWSQVKGLYR